MIKIKRGGCNYNIFYRNNKIDKKINKFKKGNKIEMIKKIYFVSFLIILCISTCPFWNNVFAKEELKSPFLLEEIVVVASKYPQDLLESVVSVEIIDEQEITASQSENLAGIIKNIAGIEITEYGSAGDIRAISIRGSSPEQVLILIDGIVANDPQTGKIDLGLIPADIIEKIEIYRGPASALYGANALGGVINIITKKGLEAEEGRVKISYGSYNTQKYQLSYQDRGDDVDYYYISGQYYKTDGDRENSQLDKISFMGKMSTKIDQQTVLDLAVRYHDYKRGLPGSIDYPTANAQQNDSNFNINAKWQKKEEEKDINISAWYDFHRVYFDNPGEWGHTGPSIHKTQVAGIALDNTLYDFSFGSKNDSNNNHTLTWGTELRQNRVSSTDIGKQHDLNGAVFIQDVWQTTILEKLSVTAGLRYDHNQTFGGQLNPRAGIVYQLQDDISLHASIGRAYRAPTFDDLYWPNDGYVVGNPDLLPETAWAYEAGLRFVNEKGDKQAGLTVFRKNTSQLINWAADSEGLWWPSNISSARTDGLEIIAENKFDENFTGDVNYTYLNVIDLATGTQLKPNHKIGFGLTYFNQFGDNNDDFTVNLEGYMVAGRPDNLDNYYLFDTNISRDFTLKEDKKQKIRLSFSIKNIFDQTPELVAGYPLQGRTFLLGISTDF